jgi:hypothetical protein
MRGFEKDSKAPITGLENPFPLVLETNRQRCASALVVKPLTRKFRDAKSPSDLDPIES